MPSVATASLFLDMIERCPHLSQTVRVDPNIFCRVRMKQEMAFIATDQDQWFGTLIVQWPTIPPHDLSVQVDDLLLWVNQPRILEKLDRDRLIRLVAMVSIGAVDVPSQLPGVSDEQVALVREVYNRR